MNSNPGGDDPLESIRRKEKAITEREEILRIIEQAKFVTIAMCRGSEPYLVTLSHGLDRDRSCIYFHCAAEGKKIDILKDNNLVWGQALIDEGYVQGACDHLYATAQFKGRVTFVEDYDEKKQALNVMVKALEDDPTIVIEEQIIRDSITKVSIGRIDIEDISGKKAEEVVISL